jgi:hypothetical protein
MSGKEDMSRNRSGEELGGEADEEDVCELDVDAAPLFSSISTRQCHSYKYKSRQSGEVEKLRYFTGRDAWRFVGPNYDSPTEGLRGHKECDTTSLHLFADDVWPGALVLADYLSSNPEIVFNKTVCEIGAGECGLPSLLSWHLDAKFVCVTDFPSVSSVVSTRLSETNAKQYSHKYCSLKLLKIYEMFSG